MTIDALSLVVCTMMGLALGVDYSLLVVSRFREELAAGRTPGAAAPRQPAASAGRTTLFAGTTLIVALVFSAFLQPGSLLLSLAVATAVVTAISVAISTLALPPLLALLGARVDRRPPAAAHRRKAAHGRRGGGRRPAPSGPRRGRRRRAAGRCWSCPALAFTTGPPGIDELSASNSARQAAETIDRAVGPGWESPFVLVAATERGPITDRHSLAVLARAEHRIAAEPGIRAVIGPAPIARRRRRRCARSGPSSPAGRAAKGSGAPEELGRARARTAPRRRRGHRTAHRARRRRRRQRPPRRGLRTRRRRRRADRLRAASRRRPRRRSDDGDRTARRREPAAGRGPEPDRGRHPDPGARPALAAAAGARRRARAGPRARPPAGTRRRHRPLAAPGRQPRPHPGAVDRPHPQRSPPACAKSPAR